MPWQDPSQSGPASGGGPAPTPAGLADAVYAELRALAAHYLQQERVGHTLQPTALVHEAYLRLAEQTRAKWQSKAHFVAVAAEIMRRVLVDHARAAGALKRGGPNRRVTLDTSAIDSERPEIDLLALDDALKRLAALEERHARVVELRFFGGLSVPQTAEILGVSTRSVENDWHMARAWLRRELTDSASLGTSP